jgi:hypothetical protein
MSTASSSTMVLPLGTVLMRGRLGADAARDFVLRPSGDLVYCPSPAASACSERPVRLCPLDVNVTLDEDAVVS